MRKKHGLFFIYKDGNFIATFVKWCSGMLDPWVVKGKAILEELKIITKLGLRFACTVELQANY